MAKKEWNSLKGQRWQMGVGVTMTEALNAEDATKLFVTTDGKLVMNGEVVDNVVGTMSVLAFSTDGKNIVDDLTLKLRNGVSVESVKGVVEVMNLCVEHGLVLKDQDYGMLVGVSSYEDMGLMYYSLTGMGIGQMKKGPVPSLFNLTLAYDKDNATLEVKERMANVDVSLLKKLIYKEKNPPKYAPCVHKAIPTCPKEGRRYFSSNGTFHVNLSFRVLMSTGETFVWDEKKFGRLISVRDLPQGRKFFIKHYINDDLSKYKSVNATTYRNLFYSEELNNGEYLGEAQYEFQIGNGGPTVLTINSDEAVFGSKKFAYTIETFYDRAEQTASPYFVLQNGHAIFVKPAVLNLRSAKDGEGKEAKYSRTSCKNFRGFYKKYPRGYRTFADKKLLDDTKMGKRWKEVCTKFGSTKYVLGEQFHDIYNELPINNQSKVFRLYPCKYNGFRRKYKSIYYVEVYYDKGKNVKDEDRIRLV